MSLGFFEKMRPFLNGRWAALLYTLFACVTVTFSLEHYAIPLFILWILFVLLLDSNFLNVFLPVTLLCGFAIRTSGQSTILLKHVWLAFPVVVVVALYLILYAKRKKLRFLPSHLAVSAALLLGGAFSISSADYFKLDALYYVFFLGIGMLFFYVWFRIGVASNEYYEVREKLMECFLFLGAFCAYSILEQAVRCYLFTGAFFTPYVWSNDICEFMIFCIPAAFYYARKQYAFLFVGCGFYAVMFLTHSYAAILAGGALVAFCFLYLAKNRSKYRFFTLGLLAALAIGAIVLFARYVASRGGLYALFLEEENGRLALIKEAWQNFLESPIFGAGIGDPGDGSATFMTINWTHNFIFQIIGSMGLVGILAYGYQLYERVRLVSKLRDPLSFACVLSYLGLFLISMLQPGEFCPMPYAMMAVMIFSTLEAAKEETDAVSESNEKTAVSS